MYALLDQRANSARHPGVVPDPDTASRYVHLDRSFDLVANKSDGAVHRYLRHRTQINGFGAQRHVPSANARRVEKTLEHLRQPIRLIDDRLQPRLRAVGVAATNLALGHLRGSAHNGDRIAEIMRRDRHELLRLLCTRHLLHAESPTALQVTGHQSRLG